MSVVDDVIAELAEMASIGIPVPAGAQAYCDEHASEIEEYRHNGMKISEIADLVCDLVGLAGRKDNATLD